MYTINVNCFHGTKEQKLSQESDTIPILKLILQYKLLILQILLEIFSSVLSS